MAEIDFANLGIGDFRLSETCNSKSAAWMKHKPAQEWKKIRPKDPQGAERFEADVKRFAREAAIKGDTFTTERKYSNNKGLFWTEGAPNLAWDCAIALLYGEDATELSTVDGPIKILGWLKARFKVRLGRHSIDEYEPEEFQRTWGKSARFIEDKIRNSICSGDAVKVKHAPMKHLDDEVKALQRELAKVPELENLWGTFKEMANSHGKFLSCLVHSIEAQLTMAVKEACEEKGWECNGVKRCGGLYVKGDRRDAPLNLCTAVCNRLCPGLDLQWKWKEWEYAIYDKDHNECNALEIEGSFAYDPTAEDVDPRFKPTYEQLREEFRGVHYQVGSVYVDTKKVPDEIAIMGAKVFEIENRRLCYFKTDKEGQLTKHPYITEWTRDETMDPRYTGDETKRQFFNRFGMYFESDKCPSDVFNTWRGFAAAGMPPIGSTEREKKEAAEYVRRVLEHIRMGCGSDPKLYDFTLDWMAHLFQYPQIKIGIMLCLVSKLKGTGKTTVWEVLKAMVSMLSSWESQHTKDICGDNNGKMLDRLLVRLVETGRKEFIQNINALKSMITDPTIRIRNLYEAAMTIDSFHRLFCDTNELDAIPDTDGERRFFIVLWQPVHARDKAYYTAFYDEIVKNPVALRAVYEFLMARPIQKHYNESDIPLSAFQKKVRAVNRSLCERFVMYVVDQHPVQRTQPFRKDADALVDAFKEFRGSAEDKEYVKEHVLRQLDLGSIPGVTRDRPVEDGKKRTVYEFDPVKLRAAFSDDLEMERPPILVAMESGQINTRDAAEKAFGLHEGTMLGSAASGVGEVLAREAAALVRGRASKRNTVAISDRSQVAWELVGRFQGEEETENPNVKRARELQRESKRQRLESNGD